MSLNVHFLHNSLNFFHEHFGDVSEEKRERKYKKIASKIFA